MTLIYIPDPDQIPHRCKTCGAEIVHAHGTIVVDLKTIRLHRNGRYAGHEHRCGK